MQTDKPLFTNRSLAALIWPLLIETALSVTIGMADTVMVSSLGEEAVSSISLVDNINILLIQIISALAAGGSVVVSQYVGSGEPGKGCASARCLYQVCLILSLAMAIPALLFTRPIITMIFGALDESVMSGCQVYFILSALSYPFLGLYNAGAALFRAMGNSKISMKASIVMNIVNVAGNALLIYVIPWGIAGAALSTLVSRALGGIYLTALLHRKSEPIHVEKLWKPDLRWDDVRRILKLGVPNGLENGMFQLGKLLVLRLIATLGTMSIAVNAVCNTLSGLSILPGMGISMGMVTVSGQCMGARRPHEAAQNSNKLMLASHALMAATCALQIIFVHPLVGFFHLSPEASVIAVRIMTIYGFMVVAIWPESFALPATLRGAGDASFCMITSLVSMWLFRIGMSYILIIVCRLGVDGVWYAMYADWIVRAAAFIIRFLRGRWKAIRVI